MNWINQTIADFLQGVRTKGTKAAPLYCVRDICDRLGLSRGGMMASAWRLPPGEKEHRIVKTARGPHLHLFITTKGFLRLAMASHTTAAKAFRAKVAANDLPKELRPAEMALIESEPPKAVMALPKERRQHILFWLSVMAEIAGSRRHNETITKLAKKYQHRGGVSKSSCARNFKLWKEAGGDWRVFDRWARIRRKSAMDLATDRTAS